MTAASQGPRVIAHRGASDRWAEHTRAAYLQALDDGADGLECDVRLTADRELVCWHDTTVDRTSDGHGPVHEHTLAELRRLDIASWKSPSVPSVPSVPSGYGPASDQLLTFTDLLDLARSAGRPVALAVELKHPSPFGFDAEDAVLAALDAAGWEPGTGAVDQVSITFMSFHPGSLQHLGAFVPSAHLMTLTDEQDVAAAVAEHAPSPATRPTGSRVRPRVIA